MIHPKVIYKEPRSGKTTELIKRCAVNGGLIVCAYQTDAFMTERLANDLGFKILKPITFEEFLAGNYDKRNVNSVCIDRADLFIQYVARGINVDAIAIDDLSKC